MRGGGAGFDASTPSGRGFLCLERILVFVELSLTFATVMPALVAGIHDFTKGNGFKVVDARHKVGHDEGGLGYASAQKQKALNAQTIPWLWRILSQ